MHDEYARTQRLPVVSMFLVFLIWLRVNLRSDTTGEGK
jgi:hypothetical protein